jgi:Transposase DDE domain
MDGTGLPEVLQSIFEECALMIDNECIKRKRVLNGSSLAKILVFGLLQDPDATGVALSQAAANIGVSISSQGIENRLDQPAVAEFLRSLLELAIKKGVAVPSTLDKILQRFTAVELMDSTTVTLPDALEDIWSGCGAKSPQGGKSAMKIQTRFDLNKGTLRLDLTPGRASDQSAALQTTDLQPGSLHVRDLGYFDVETLQTIEDAGACFLTYLVSNTAVYDLQGNRLNLPAFLRAQTQDVDQWVLIGSETKMKVRLMAVRVPEEVANGRRRRLRKKAKSKGYTPTDAAMELRGWTIMVSNVAADKLSLDDALAVMRQRWQIELLFKLWKSHGRLGHTNRKLPQRILAETYAKLLALLIQHWVLWLALGQYADRSLVKGSSVVRRFAWQLARNIASLTCLAELCASIVKTLEKTARIQKRAKKPAAFQVLGNPAKNGYKRRERA